MTYTPFFSTSSDFNESLNDSILDSKDSELNQTKPVISNEMSPIFERVWQRKTMAQRKAIAVAYKSEESRNQHFSHFEEQPKNDEEPKKICLENHVAEPPINEVKTEEKKSNEQKEPVKKVKILGYCPPLVILAIAIRFLFYIGQLFNIC